MSLAHLFSPEERTRLVHAVYVVAACIAYSLFCFAVLGADPKLQALDFFPDSLRLFLTMVMMGGTALALPVAAWVTLYNSAFFIGRLRKRGRKSFGTKP